MAATPECQLFRYCVAKLGLYYHIVLPDVLANASMAIALSAHTPRVQIKCLV